MYDINKNENEERRIARLHVEEIEAILEGRIIKCPTCGEWVEFEEVEREDDERELVEGWECPSCMHWQEEEPEESSVWEYINEHLLDYDFRIDSSKAYRGARLYLGLGGPTVYIDTERDCVVCHWGSSECYYFSTDAAAQVDDIGAELYAIC